MVSTERGHRWDDKVSTRHPCTAHILYQVKGKHEKSNKPKKINGGCLEDTQGQTHLRHQEGGLGPNNITSKKTKEIRNPLS